MIDIKKAYDIALTDSKKTYEKSEINNCIDIGGRFVFSLSCEGYSIKGAPLISVDKNNGEIGYLHLPNVKIFELLRNGEKIDLTEIGGN
jgi:hypothetical protein